MFNILYKLKRFYYSLTPEIRAIKKWRKNNRKEVIIERSSIKYYGLVIYSVKDDLVVTISKNIEKLIKQEIHSFLEFATQEIGLTATYFAHKDKFGVFQISKQRALEVILFKHAI